MTEEEKIFYFIQIDENEKEKMVPPKYLLQHGFSMDEVIDIMQEISKNDRKGLHTIVNIKTKQITITDSSTPFDYSMSKKKQK